MKKPLAIIASVLACLVSAGAHAVPIKYVAVLDGPSEFPPIDSPGSGFAKVVYDDVAHTLRVRASFADLVGTTTVAHIHCCTVVPLTATIGVATAVPTFPGFPAGVMSGDYFSVFDLTLPESWNPAFITANGGTPAGAEARLAAGLASGSAYFNIHSTFAPGGEIRGFLAVPEPSTLALLGLGVAGLGLARRRKA